MPLRTQSRPYHRPITRRAFGAYSPDLWLVQTYLQDLGFPPGSIDGQWGPNTKDAAQQFASNWGIDPGIVTDVNSVVAGSNMFGTALRSAARDAGLDMTLTAPSGVGGAGTAPEVSEDTGPSSRTETPAGGSGGFGGLLMPLALLGIGAVLVFAKKR
jgi:hypothetical protein